jgi:antitoxin MazE
MNVKLIQIGGSRGIRIPKAVLAQCNVKTELELTVVDEKIILKPKEVARSGWAEAAMEMKNCSDDVKLLPDVFSDEDMDDIPW